MRGRFGAAALALWTALTIGAMGVQVGSWLGWRGAPPLPSDAAAVALARDAVPLVPPGEVARQDEIFGYEYAEDSDDPRVWLLGTDERYLGGAVRVTYPAGAAAEQLFAEVPGRLAAAGWQTGEVWGDVVAHRDGWHLVVAADGPGGYLVSTESVITVRVIRGEPALVWWCALAGLLLALPPGWWLAGALRRTLPRYGAVLLQGCLLLLLPQPLIAAPSLVPPWWRDAAPPDPAWGINNEAMASCCAGVAGMLFAALLVTAVARRGRLVSRVVPQPARINAALALTELTDRP